MFNSILNLFKISAVKEDLHYIKLKESILCPECLIKVKEQDYHFKRMIVRLTAILFIIWLLYVSIKKLGG